jgi:hypothetical protein
MKVLVATCLGQGRKAHDVCTTLEGELVALPPTDHLCFLHQRVVSGISSGGETTTFMVVDRPELDRDKYRDAIKDGLKKGRWEIRAEADDLTVDELVDAMLCVALTLAPGTILERVGRDVRVRLHPDWTPGAAA